MTWLSKGDVVNWKFTTNVSDSVVGRSTLEWNPPEKHFTLRYETPEAVVTFESKGDMWASEAVPSSVTKTLETKAGIIDSREITFEKCMRSSVSITNGVSAAVGLLAAGREVDFVGGSGDSNVYYSAPSRLLFLERDGVPAGLLFGTNVTSIEVR